MKKTIIIVSILILAGSGFYGWKRWKASKDGDPKFRKVEVVRGDLLISVNATGSVQPRNRLELKPPIAGRIEQVLVEEGNHVRKGQVLAWMSSSERAALLDAARTQGPGEYERWEKIYRPAPVMAPMDGVIIARNVEPGQTISAADAPLVMSDRLIVKATVDETDIGRVRLKQRTVIVLDAYPDKKIPGEVLGIAYEAKTVNNVTMYEIDVVPESIPPFMRAGMTADITFQVQKKQDILLLPQEAVKEKEGEKKVMVPSVNAEGTGKKKKRFEMRAVETGMTDGKNVEILSGLEEGDVVLISEMKLGGGGNQAGTNPFMPIGRRPGGGRGR